MPVSHLFTAASTGNYADWATISSDTRTVSMYNSTGGTFAADVSTIVGPSEWNAAHNVAWGSDFASMFAVEHRLTKTTDASGITLGVDNEIGFFEPLPLIAGIFTGAGLNTWYFDPVNFVGAFNSGQFREILQFGTGSTASNAGIFQFGASTLSGTSSGIVTKGGTIYNRMALYMRDSLSTTKMVRQWSTEHIYRFSMQVNISNGSATSNNLTASINCWFNCATDYDASGGFTTADFTGSASSAAAATSMAVSALTTQTKWNSAVYLLTGPQLVAIPVASRITAGDWYVGFCHQISTAQASTGGGYSLFGNVSSVSKVVQSELSTIYAAAKSLGATNSVTNSSTQFFPGHGFLATTFDTAPANVVFTADIRQNASMYRHYFQFNAFPR